MLVRWLIEHGKWHQNYEKAAETLSKIKPDNYAVCIYMGQKYSYLGKDNKAEEMFRKAIEYDPKNAKAYSLLGLLYSSQGKYIEADEMYLKAAEFDPEDDFTSGQLWRTFLRC